MDRDYDFLPVGDNAANNAEEQGLAILAAITAQADNPAVFNTNPGEDKVTTEMWETRHKTKTLESLIIIISGTGVTINTAPDGSLVSVHAPAGTAFTITMQWATVEED